MTPVQQVLSISKAFSDPNRLRALSALCKGELCVCRIIALLGLAPSTVSKHMSVLKNAGLVENRKKERWIYYRLPDLSVCSKIIREALGWVFNTTSGDGQIEEDRKRLAKILGQSPEMICKKRVEKFRCCNNKKGKNHE